MKLKVIKMPVTEEDIFLRYVEYVILPWKKIPYKAGVVFSRILYYYHKYSKDLPKEDAMSKAFSYESRIAIQEELNVKEQPLNNYISALKKHNLVYGEKKINRINEAIIFDLEKNKDGILIKFEYAGQSK